MVGSGGGAGGKEEMIMWCWCVFSEVTVDFLSGEKLVLEETINPNALSLSGIVDTGDT